MGGGREKSVWWVGGGRKGQKGCVWGWDEEVGRLCVGVG